MLPIIYKKSWYYAFSGTMVLVSWILLATWGLKPGLDFTGGSLMQVRFTANRPSVDAVSVTVSDIIGESPVIQPAGNESFILRTKTLSTDVHGAVLSALRSLVPASTSTQEGSAPSMVEERFEMVGPTVSAELREKSFSAGIAVVIAIIFFVAWSFRKVSRPVPSWVYGIAAVLALVHDVSITMGVFVLLGKFFGIEVDVAFIVALLTILGYSVNDTIVVFDRIREKLAREGSTDFFATVNRAVNETIGRSVNTSLTVLFTLFALFIFGGDTTRYFSLALIVGIGFGTYSSIFLASPLLLEWYSFMKRRGLVR